MDREARLSNFGYKLSARLKRKGWCVHVQRKGSMDKALSKAVGTATAASLRYARRSSFFACLAQLQVKTLRSLWLASVSLHQN